MACNVSMQKEYFAPCYCDLLRAKIASHQCELNLKSLDYYRNLRAPLITSLDGTHD